MPADVTINLSFGGPSVGGIMAPGEATLSSPPSPPPFAVPGGPSGGPSTQAPVPPGDLTAGVMLPSPLGLAVPSAAAEKLPTPFDIPGLAAVEASAGAAPPTPTQTPTALSHPAANSDLPRPPDVEPDASGGTAGQPDERRGRGSGRPTGRNK